MHLLHRTRTVGLDGAQGAAELGGDFSVRPAGDHASKDFLLAVGQRLVTGA